MADAGPQDLISDRGAFVGETDVPKFGVQLRTYCVPGVSLRPDSKIESPERLSMGAGR